jgi:predicted nucleic acid-binding protein
MKKYCLDTNVLIEAWNKYYSMSLCPEFWEILDDLARRGIIFCTMEVKKEIQKADDGLSNWVGTRPHIFKEVTEDVQANLRIILEKHGRLVDSSRGRSTADPWVIAHANSEKAVVVTKEGIEKTGSKRIKIPNVCIDLGIAWMDDFQFFNEVGMKFSAKLGA